MSHLIDFTTGKAGIAFIGETPWHGLGQQLTPDQPIEVWQVEAGLDWECKAAPVRYQRETIDFERGGMLATETLEMDGQRVLYRSDSGEALSVVSSRYRPVQPRDVLEFYRDLTERYGFQLETAGSLKGGRKVWALANTRHAIKLGGIDEVKGYLLLATSFDGSMATQARFTSVRVVCNNTLTVAAQGRADVTVRHSTSFDADRVKLDLRIAEQWQEFGKSAEQMTKRPMTIAETARFMMDAILGLETAEQQKEFATAKETEKQAAKFMERMSVALNSPGSMMPGAEGTLWGVLNAVTYDIDHAAPSRNQENRLDRAWFGPGEAIKQKALQRALALI